MVRIHPDPPPNEHDGGAIAQLGERLLCKQEVIGSIPIGSTSITRGNSNQSRVRGSLVLLQYAQHRSTDRLLFNNLGLEGSCLCGSRVVMTRRVAKTLGYVLHESQA